MNGSEMLAETMGWESAVKMQVCFFPSESSRLSSVGEAWITHDRAKNGATLIVMLPIRPICSGVTFAVKANNCRQGETRSSIEHVLTLVAPFSELNSTVVLSASATSFSFWPTCRCIGKNHAPSEFISSLYRLRFVIGMPRRNTLNVECLLPPPTVTSCGYVRA